ncbi:LOW QUALITY PROTEIN: uncharacterized protein Dyak_GE28327 [Drosophila yakuba]|uniref:Uncharacterized protein n=1 Tax=Drosophila yakuba TaxID=7245 RepID=A0A0R1E7I6_DROYA|nr:LOW QUALITY PROTEIN: uncharacterized protein Dyak_GE28327 [Drosophila yakuba]
MRVFFLILIIFGYFVTVFNHVTFTNLKCETRDEKFCNFQKCFIKAVNRTLKYIDIRVILYQKANNVTTKKKLMRHNHNLYHKPFFLDITFDVCKILKNPQQSVVKNMYEIYKNSSNINHTCQYENDIIVDHVWTGKLESDIVKYIFMIDGDYTKWSVYNVGRAFINIYKKVSNRNL